MIGTDDTGTERFGISSFAARSGGNARTVQVYETYLGRVESWVGTPLMDASLRDLEALKKRLRGMRSGKWYAGVLRMFYNAAAEVTDDPKYAKYARMLRLKQRTERLQERDILTLPEVNRLLEAANTLRDRALIVVLWETGARIHEVLALNLGHVGTFPSPENGGRTFYKVSFRKVKVRGEEHAGYVLEGADHLAAWLKVHPDLREDAPLFVSNRIGRLSPTRARELLKRISNRATIGKNITPHTFRHSRATHLLRIGVPETQVKILLGWTPNSNMLARYSHLVNRDAYNALLRAHGLSADEKVDLGKLAAAEGELRPVVPMLVAGTPPPPQEEAELVSAIVQAIVRRPEVLEAVRAALAKGGSA